MQIHNVVQGSPEWHALRANRFTASEAPAMMGCSPYMTRGDLLRQKATGIAPEFDEAAQRRFAAGHAAEAAYRPIAESDIGDDLYPVTGTAEIEGMALLASFDGLTMDGAIGYEHKLHNKALADALADDGEPGPAYYWQLEHQLLVSGAQRVMFVTSDGTDSHAAWCWYESCPERRAKLIAGWKQFAADLAGYAPPAAEPPKPTGRAPQTLPALRIEVSGQVTASNLAEFKANALTVLAGINRNLQTDSDFADAEQTVKWCGEVETRIKAAKDNALSQTASIEDAFRVMDDVAGEVRRVRLDLEKLVKSEKETRRLQIVMDGVQALRQHVASLNARLGVDYMPAIDADFAGAVKSKKNIDNMRDAVATELARAKIAANEVADRIQANLAALRERQEMAFLFPDVKSLVLKAGDDLRAVITARIAEQEAKERQRLEAERERIRAEEQAKAEARAAVQAEAASAQPAAVVPMPAAMKPVAANDGPPTLRLGEINARLQHISVTAEGLRALGFEPAATERRAVLYHERQFQAICMAISHCALQAVSARNLPKAA